ncbi:unnamed protein product [Rotaria sp. Silwood2]|nr:unnamed protein product [Rotaria sp. Silwood2]
MLISKKLHQIDSIFLIYSIWWSIIILITLITFILSILCINQCSNEYILPYLLLGHSCFTFLIIILLCYLRHGNDKQYINYLSVIILFIYFISFVFTTIFTFRRIKYVIYQTNNSEIYCLSYCYYIAIIFFTIQIITIILQLPLACFILVLSAKNSYDRIQSKKINISINDIHTCNSI